ncbi:hypothetical protein CR201_G0002428 [Pongo abelii]|uniref:Uncharacterized protein n=1 Tax=Pongo abelii TaxID=9601 RepID=A0A2J8XGU1_PONAB|nr:hypothetical protein CR201_G0002428 [Pongo abelii]
MSPTTPTPHSLPPNQVCKKQNIDAGSPTLECPLVAKPGTSHPYIAICGSATRMNAIHTKELLLTSHLQSPPGHRQDPFNKPSSETPIVQNLQLATGYHHSLWLCKIKDLEAGWGRWKL